LPSSPAEPSPGSETRSRDALWGGPRVALAAILAGAAALRLVGVGYGLPFPLLSPDEQSIVPRAWKMVHGGGLDPHWFDYPSLLLYLLAPFQAWEHQPSYLAARLVVGVLALHCLLFVMRPGWVALTPLGPTQNSRFWGIGNQLETLLLVPLLAGALLAWGSV